MNFWRPRDTREFRSLAPGDLFLFKLGQPRHAIVGGGVFIRFSVLPASLAWAAFEVKNGAASLSELRTRLAQLRAGDPGPRSDFPIGCILLSRPFFLAESDWIAGPGDWGLQTVQGRVYDLGVGEGRRIWRELVQRAPALVAAGAAADRGHTPASTRATARPSSACRASGRGASAWS